ncbi:MAG: type I-A CRISPR-associated protein CsaX, partial [Candidatus Aramenus sulfurataquae]|nr:type I-A CRISPR-associated protein CsaX [Candidatus Aramenus sulfurataquae]
MTVEIPLYNIFGDNFVIALASLTKNARRSLDSVEFDDVSLKNALLTASQLSKERKITDKKGKQTELDFPKSGNDKESFNEALQCFNIPEGAQVSDILSKFAASIPQLPPCDEVTAPSMLRPEHYEYVRTPGFYRRIKASAKAQVSPVYVLVSLAGWVLTRLGRAPVGKGEYVGVYAFPIDVEKRFGMIPSLLKELGTKDVPGTEPSTALAIWLASKMLKSHAPIDQLMIYTVSEPVGKEPAAVTNGQLISVGRLLSNERFREIHEEAGAIAEKALSPNPWECDANNFSVKFSNLLFEVLSGSKREVELAYLANREYYAWKRSQSASEKC